MDDHSREVEALKRILTDTSAPPTKLSYAFIESITNYFSKSIGRGGFGEVFLGTFLTWEVAVKRLNVPYDFDDKQFSSEINVLMMAKHKNIVKFLGYCSETQGQLMEYNGKYVIAHEMKRLICFEYVPNGSLEGYLKKKIHGCDWNTRYQIIKGMCQGLQYLHKISITHLDLKPDNVLLANDMVPKITDFGLSRCFDDKKSRIFTAKAAGTWGYMAPELIDKGEISFKTDIYSLGKIMAILSIGGNKNSTDENGNKSLGVEYCLPMKRCMEIAQHCIEEDQSKRPGIDNIIDELNQIDTMIEKGNTSLGVEYRLPMEICKEIAQRYMEDDDQSKRSSNNNIIDEPNEVDTMIEKIPSFTPTEMVDVQPRKLYYSLGGEKSMAFSLRLANRTDERVAFMFIDVGTVVSSSLLHRGFIEPHSTWGVILHLERKSTVTCIDNYKQRLKKEKEKNMEEWKDKVVWRSTIALQDMELDQISMDMFEKQICVHDVELNVVYVAPSLKAKLPSPESDKLESSDSDEGSDDGTSQVELKISNMKAVTGLKFFSYGEIKSGTRCFTSLLGQGGFGSVYKGMFKINGQHRVLAVKRVDHQASAKQLLDELKILANLIHNNVVMLVGFCSDNRWFPFGNRGGRLYLCSEFCSHGSLDRHIFDLAGKGERRETLGWSIRYEIIIGICEGLLYLHRYCSSTIVHMDIKPQNILLDQQMTPKITVCLSKVFEKGKTHTYTHSVIGSNRGYVAPEYVLQGKVDRKCDIYSLGVLILGIVLREEPESIHDPCGLRFIEKVRANFNFKEANPNKFVGTKNREQLKRDASLRDSDSIEEVEKCISLAFKCVAYDPDNRPLAKMICRRLEGQRSWN